WRTSPSPCRSGRRCWRAWTGSASSNCSRTTLLGDYFSDPFDGELDRLLLLSGSLGPDGARQMKLRLDEVAREFDGLLARDASLPAEQRVGVSLVLAQKPWLLRLFEAYRRARQDH